MRPVFLIDLDDTLVSRAALFRQWAVEKCSAHGLGEDAVEQIIALDMRGNSPRLEFMAGVRDLLHLDSTPEELVREWETTFPLSYRLAPGQREGLERARAAGIRLGVVTNGRSAVQRLKLTAAGLEGFFDAVVVSDDIGVRKPDPAIFQYATELCSADASAGWFFGDNPVADLSGARAIGMRTAWIAGGSYSWPDDQPPPDVTAPDLAAAIDSVLALRDQEQPKSGPVD